MRYGRFLLSRDRARRETPIGLTAIEEVEVSAVAAMYRCETCYQEILRELPPLWDDDEEDWPQCCERPALLLYPLERVDH